MSLHSRHSQFAYSSFVTRCCIRRENENDHDHDHDQDHDHDDGPSTLNSQPSTLNSQPSTLNSQLLYLTSIITRAFRYFPATIR